MNPLASSLAAAAIAAVATWAVSRRQRSGKINTTEAAQLWAESNEMRQELRSEVVGLREDLVKRHAEIVELSEENVTCRRQLSTLNRRLRVLERQTKS